jgi:hypothetical protein
MIGWLANNELKMTLKEMVVAKFGVLFWSLLGGSQGKNKI